MSSALRDEENFERVIVVGTSCAGKTTFARHMSRSLALPHVELDELFWNPDWEPKDEAEFRRLIDTSLARPRWVVDGNYGVARDLLWPNADVVIWLNYSFSTVFFRAICRTARRVYFRELLFAGNRETLRRSFFSRESILMWVISTFRRRRKAFTQLRNGNVFPHLKWLEFRSPREARHFLAELDRVR